MVLQAIRDQAIPPPVVMTSLACTMTDRQGGPESSGHVWTRSGQGGWVRVAEHTRNGLVYLDQTAAAAPKNDFDASDGFSRPEKAEFGTSNRPENAELGASNRPANVEQESDQLLRPVESRKTGGDASPVRQTGQRGERRSCGCEVGRTQELDTERGLTTDEHTLWDVRVWSQLEHAAAPVWGPFPDPFPGPFPGPFLDPSGRGVSGPYDREQTTSTHSAPPLASAIGLCDGRIFPCKIPPDN